LGSQVTDTSPQQRALVFDSGVGGLSVVEEIRRQLPNLALDYVADDMFRPYGEKSAQQLLERLPGLIATLNLMLKPDVIVIACNTASTTALAAIRKEVSTPVIGVVPAIKPAAEMYVKLMGSLALVDYAERKLSGEEIDLAFIEAEIQPLFSKKTELDIDIIVLACTHFPLLKSELEAVTEGAVTWIDSGSAIARRTKQILSGRSRKPRLKRKDIAFLIGPDAPTERVAATNMPKDIGTAPLIMVITL